MSDTFAVFAWLTATAAPFILASRVSRRMRRSDASLDEQAFATVLGGIGALSIILHLIAATTGLSLTAALAAVACSHVALWAATRSAPVAAPPARFSSGARGIAEVLATVILAAMAVSWIDVSSQSASVTGTDAAHYHVPVAANLALGATLFDLPATPHLYPMAGSVLAAWFILPLGDPLMVDLAMCLPFLLLTVSMNWIFRLSTGQSGLAWSSWICLVLFSTPLFRWSSLVSADLWFASAFAALAAVLLSAWARRTSLPASMILGGLALGLLVGTKTTGTVTAALLLGAYLAFELGRVLARRGAPSWRQGIELPTATLAILLMLGAGGIWLVRNWHQFGSPIAPTGLTLFGVSIFDGEPFEPTSYLSVRGDLERDATYDLARRVARYIRLWLGEAFVPALLLLVLVPLDLACAWARRERQAAAVRGLLLLCTVGVGAALVWLLIGAPWTSLEWTGGFSLRYALPLAALLPLVAFIALFPVSFRWYEDHTAATIGLAAVITASALAFRSALDPQSGRYVNVPSISMVWVAVAGLALLASRWAVTRRRSPTPVMLVLGLVLAMGAAPVIAGRAERERQVNTATQMQDRASLLSAPPESSARHVYLLTLADEDAAGRRCEGRRFFALSRLDEPLMLQSPAYTNQVFYAGRDLRTTSRVPPMTSCDYILTAPAVLQTEKGAALIASLAGGFEVTSVGTAGSFTVLRRTQTPVTSR